MKDKMTTLLKNLEVKVAREEEVRVVVKEVDANEPLPPTVHTLLKVCPHLGRPHHCWVHLQMDI